MYPRPIQQLIDAFSHLPGVGPRSAERFVFYLLKSGKKEVAVLTATLAALKDGILSCQVCWNFSDQSPCRICTDAARGSTIAVVAEPFDLEVIERTKSYHGHYHVLRGVINVANEETLSILKIPQLLARLKNSAYQEVILALNPDLPGETTMLMLERQIKEQFPKMNISRLARGIPLGGDVRYADDITLVSALKNRTKL